MEQKKTEKANLENKRGFFFEIGFIATLAVLLLAFEWSTKVEKAEDLGTVDINVEDEEMAPITEQPQVELPPPPPPQQTVSDVIEIVDDKVVVDDVPWQDVEDQDAEVPVDIPVETAPVEEEPEEPQVFFIVEEMPEFPGGELALRKYLAENVKYPEMAKENDIQGTVYVRFVVDTDGSVKNVELMRGVDPLLDKEALRVVSSLPKFKPGKQRGKAVKVSHQVPIKFALAH
ncbi:MAG: energy transducer TonB [Bacteroidales bacterium]|nr:energy transducer TonB [Bacteroidales bacterium]